MGSGARQASGGLLRAPARGLNSIPTYLATRLGTEQVRRLLARHNRSTPEKLSRARMHRQAYIDGNKLYDNRLCWFRGQKVSKCDRVPENVEEFLHFHSIHASKLSPSVKKRSRDAL